MQKKSIFAEPKSLGKQVVIMTKTKEIYLAEGCFFGE
jgi:hypothetical protein